MNIWGLALRFQRMRRYVYPPLDCLKHWKTRHPGWKGLIPSITKEGEAFYQTAQVLDKQVLGFLHLPVPSSKKQP